MCNENVLVICLFLYLSIFFLYLFWCGKNMILSVVPHFNIGLPLRMLPKNVKLKIQFMVSISLLNSHSN